MAIKNKSKDPKATDLSKKELVINVKEGKLFYKSDKGLHKSIAENEENITPGFTSSGIFAKKLTVTGSQKIVFESSNDKDYVTVSGLVVSGSSGIGSYIIGSSFTIGNSVEIYGDLGVGNIDVSGSIIPTSFGTYDLGSSEFPFQDIHVMTSSIRFYDLQGEVGKIQFTRDEGMQIKQVKETQDTSDTDIEYEEDIASSFSASLMTATTKIKSPTGSFDFLEVNTFFNIDGGSF